MDRIFVRRNVLEEHEWDFAYPKSKPITQYQPIILDERLFYINAVESAASTMEASVLGAKNVALLLKNSLI